MGMGVCAAPGSAQSQTDEVLTQRLDLHINNGTLLQALTTLAVEKRVPIGFEPSLAHKDGNVLTINVDGATLRDVLELIAHQVPAYKWEVKDGAVNFIPESSRDEIVERLLATPISNFVSQSGLNKFALRDVITNLPEVRSLLKSEGLTATRTGYYYRQQTPSRATDLSISNTDLRGVLNKVVRDSEHKMWVVVRSGPKREFLNIGF
jgi:hypothetical protein